MDTRQAEALLALRRAGSLSGAAAALGGLAVSTVARRLDALEATLKLRLVDRRADGARLTAEGEAVAALAEPLVDRAAALRRAADALRPRGAAAAAPVRVSATEPVVAEVLAPALPALWAAEPLVAVALQVQTRTVSLAGRDAEVAVRLARPGGASLVARRLPALRLAFHASPAYLAGRAPAALDLRRERLLAYDASYGAIPEVQVLSALGLEGAVALRTGSTRALLTAARAGAGVALLPAVLAARAGGLVELPAPGGTLPPPRSPWLVVHADLRRVPAVVAVRRWIERAFQALHAEPRLAPDRPRT